jgi:hypothetical protein
MEASDAVSMEPKILDCGAYIEILIGAPKLRNTDFIEVLLRGRAMFGAKPILVICDDPGGDVNLNDAYRVGVDIAMRLPSQRVAIALRGRHASDAERFTELVAANRGLDLRYFDDVANAREWVTASFFRVD